MTNDHSHQEDQNTLLTEQETASVSNTETTDQQFQPAFLSPSAQQQTKPSHISEPRPFQPKPFFFGLILATGGIGLMLFVAAGALHDAGGAGAVSLPATGLFMVLGLMMLGGGFGQMAISSPQFDDTEFQRLLNGETETSETETSETETSEIETSEIETSEIETSETDDCVSDAGASRQTFDQSADFAANGRSDTTTSADQQGLEPKQGLTTAMPDDLGQPSDASPSKKRPQAETSDSFVSTVLSDVVASQG